MAHKLALTVLAAAGCASVAIGAGLGFAWIADAIWRRNSSPRVTPGA